MPNPPSDGYWPARLPRHLPPMRSTLAHNLAVTVARHGARPGIGFYVSPWPRARA